MRKKSLLDTKKFVPQYFANGREFQVFLRAINIAMSVIKSNTDNFIPNLLNPLKCKERLLPLLANYVGYDYNPRERVLTNRWIIKLYPLLIRNRGNEIGITLAIAMAICLMGNPEELYLENNFSMEYEEESDKWGRLIPTLKIYMYVQDYLPILKDLIETVRPAGIKVNFIPTVDISSSETIALTDEFSIRKYDYITGKLLSINDIDIVVQNSWPLLYDIQEIKHFKWEHLKDWQWGDTPNRDKDTQYASSKTWGELEDTGIEAYGAIPGLAPYNIDNKNDAIASRWNATNIYLIDGKFYDRYGNYLNRSVDPLTGKILYENDEWQGEYIKNTRIYTRDESIGKDIYTGLYFDVSEPAKVMNTYYKLLDDGIFSGFYLSNDDMTIVEATTGTSEYKLVESQTLVNGHTETVWKVYTTNTNERVNWHVNIKTRQFVMDDDGNKHYIKDRYPFSETTYIGKKAYLVVKSKDETGATYISASKYFVNKYGDIVDPAGNIILSKKDRYKVSDSNMIGFSEVHNNAKQLSTFDGTNILQREWSFMKDEDIPDKHGRDNTNDFEEYKRVTDPRCKFDYTSFKLEEPIREYTGTELIRFISNEELQTMHQEHNTIRIPLFITDFDSENASGTLIINTDLPYNYSLGDVFKNLNIRFENKVPNDEINPKWDVYIDWVANKSSKSLFNLNDLENPIHFIKQGRIEPRTLHWTGKPIYITPKMYDGTTKVYLKGDD